MEDLLVCRDAGLLINGFLEPAPPEECSDEYVVGMVTLRFVADALECPYGLFVGAGEKYC